MSQKNFLEKYAKKRVANNIKTELLRFEPEPEKYYQMLKKFPLQDKEGLKFLQISATYGPG